MDLLAKLILASSLAVEEKRMTIQEIRSKKLKAEQEINRILSDLSEEIDLPMEVCVDVVKVVRTFNSDRSVFNTKIEVKI